MSKIVKKWRKVVAGCANRNQKESLIENDFLGPAVASNYEFNFDQQAFEQNLLLIKNDSLKMPIYNEYDNLEHHTLIRNTKLKEITNNQTQVKGFRRFFSGKSIDKNEINTQEDYAELHCNNTMINKNEQMKEIKDRNNNIELARRVSDEIYYCEISDSSNLMCENEPLIDLLECSNSNPKKLKTSGSRVNLSDNGMALNETLKNEPLNGLNLADDENLTDIRDIGDFANQNEATNWYLNLLHDRMSKCVREEKSLNASEMQKRLNIVTAHLLYARNFYEMRVNSSNDLKLKLEHTHPCLIALACLLDSDGVRIVDSHNCSCDANIYMFATRVKFCSWKSRLFIILKRPKRSSIDRLTFIENLTNCRKIIKS